MIKVYVVGGATNYTSFIQDVELVSEMKNADVVMFTGGEDVSSELYGCEKHLKTYSNKLRDDYEVEEFKKVKPNQLVVGICRGSQLLCVLNGGLLVQHVNNHAIGTTHAIKSINDEYLFQITSTHHQMQYPYNLPSEDYDLLYIADGILSDRFEGDQINPYKIGNNGEPEIVLYHKEGLPRCLAIQGHPEMIPNFPVAKMLSKMIHNLCK